MAKKNKNQTLTVDVAKALWEEYSNIIKENWTTTLARAVASEDWEAVRDVGKKMESFKFDFNRSN